MNVMLATTQADLELICPVLLQLRSQYSKETLLNQIQQHQKFGYQIAYVINKNQVACVAGFIFGFKLAWGKHIYVDDLVTDSRQRSLGAGKTLIQWLIRHAREQGCEQLHLDSGVQCFGAHRFYLREGFDINSHHFALTDLGS